MYTAGHKELGHLTSVRAQWGDAGCNLSHPGVEGMLGWGGGGVPV